ncbi:MAG: ABC transporter permease [Petrotogales bacterium]
MKNYASLLVKISAIVAFFLAWEIIARLEVFPALLFPTMSDSVNYFVTHIENIIYSAGITLKMLLTALCMSFALGTIIGIFSSFFKTAHSIVEAFVSLFNPIPSIALLPLALLWFGLNERAVIFVTIFGSIWIFTINVTNGFSTIKPIYLSVGKNYGLKKIRLAWHIMLPAALPNILTGVRSAWGTGFRTVVAAEIVLGILGGLGFHITHLRYRLEIPGMMAYIIMVALIGIFVEHAVFSLIEKKTVKKWGMKVA